MNSLHLVVQWLVEQGQSGTSTLKFALCNRDLYKIVKKPYTKKSEISFENLALYRRLGMRKKSIGRFAALKGDLELVQWSIEQAGCPKDDTFLFLYAAKSGNLALMMWLQQIGCPMPRGICERAAEFGHLEILKWAKDLGNSKMARRDHRARLFRTKSSYCILEGSSIRTSSYAKMDEKAELFI